jgi:hypothetical protein
MLKKIINKLSEWLEDGLRGLLGRITPGGRFYLVVTMLFVFSGLSIYMTVSSIYNIGKEKGEMLQIERIEALKLQLDQAKKDSIINKQLNDLKNGK